jgi:hypothetical protein
MLLLISAEIILICLRFAYGTILYGGFAMKYDALCQHAQN